MKRGQDLFCPECTNEIRAGYMKCRHCNVELHPECLERHQLRGECIPYSPLPSFMWGSLRTREEKK